MFAKFFALFLKKKSTSQKVEPEVETPPAIDREEQEESSSVSQSVQGAITVEEEGSPEKIYSQMEWQFLGLNPESGYIFQNITEGKRACFANGTTYVASVAVHTATEMAERFSTDPNQNSKKFIPEVFFCLCKKAEDDQRVAIGKALEEKQREFSLQIQKIREEMEEQLRSQSSSDDFVKMSYPSIAKDAHNEKVVPKQEVSEEDRERIQKQKIMLEEELNSQRETLHGIDFYHEDTAKIRSFSHDASPEEIQAFDAQKKNFLSRLFITDALPIEVKFLQDAFNVFFEAFSFVGFKRFEARLKQISSISVTDEGVYTGSCKVFLSCLASLPVFAECIKALPVVKASPEAFFGYEDFKQGNRTVLENFSAQVELSISFNDIHLLERLFENSCQYANRYAETVRLFEEGSPAVEGKTVFSFLDEEKKYEQSSGPKLF